MNWKTFLSTCLQSKDPHTDLSKYINTNAGNTNALLQENEYDSFVEFLKTCDKYCFRHIVKHTTPLRWFEQTTSAIEPLYDIAEFICMREERKCTSGHLWSIAAIQDDYGLSTKKPIALLRLMEAMREYGYYLQISATDKNSIPLLQAETDYALNALGYTLEQMQTQNNVLLHFNPNSTLGDLYTVLKTQLHITPIDLTIESETHV